MIKNEQGGNKMRHHIIRVSSDLEERYICSYISKVAARKEARKEAKHYPESNVFVYCYRSDDGQMSYLNPDGNYSFTGQAY